jgi:hypothetical protein
MLFVTVSCTMNNLARNFAKVFGQLKTEEQVFRTVEHVDGLVLLAKEDALLQGIIDNLKLEDSLEWK